MTEALVNATKPVENNKGGRHADSSAGGRSHLNAVSLLLVVQLDGCWAVVLPHIRQLRGCNSRDSKRQGNKSIVVRKRCGGKQSRNPQPTARRNGRHADFLEVVICEQKLFEFVEMIGNVIGQVYLACRVGTWFRFDMSQSEYCRCL